jgi:hypothetical protein
MYEIFYGVQMTDDEMSEATSSRWRQNKGIENFEEWRLLVCYAVSHCISS